MQVLNVGRIKFDDTQLISPTAKLVPCTIFLAIQYCDSMYLITACVQSAGI